MSSMRNRYRRISKVRDGRLIIIASEGQVTEPDYFDEVISPDNYGLSGIHVYPLRRNFSNSSPRSVLQQLKSAKNEFGLNGKDQLWIVIDRDKWKDTELNEVAYECEKENFFMALSNPSFELWLLMHFCAVHRQPKDKIESICKKNDSLRDELTKKLESKSSVGFGMKAYMPYVEKAINNAKKMDRKPQDRWPLSIGTRVYVLVENIIHP
jgi:hypothetical protein